MDRTKSALRDDLGRAYVERAFAGDSKKIAQEMIGLVETAFEDNLPELAWMDDTTRQRAREKARAIRNKIGYPDVWTDYKSLNETLRADTLFENNFAVQKWWTNYSLDKFDKPKDPQEWFMSAPTVNAYYSGTSNEIVFPAGILQPPFFDVRFPAAMNFGGIGMVVGHEITHGFDDNGRKFDPTGQLRTWWEPEVAERFEERAQCVQKQYSAYEVQPELYINGKLTLGENIADLGGIKLAFKAYQAWSKAATVPDPVLEGFTSEQLFFVAFAQSWCTLETPESERVRITTDSHSPPRFRVNGSLSHFPAFAEAFSCEPGTPMRVEPACEVW